MTQDDWEIKIREKLHSGDFDGVWLDLQSLCEDWTRSGRVSYDHGEVREILNEVLAVLFRRCQSGQLQHIEHLRAYCTLIALRSLALKNPNRNVEHPSGSLPDALGDVAEPLDLVAEAECRTAIVAAVERLPERQREVFIMRYRKDMNVPSMVEFFKKLGRPRSKRAVESLLKRARLSIRQDLWMYMARKEE